MLFGRSIGSEDNGSDVEEHPGSSIREYAEAICLAIILALFIRTFGVQAFKIPSGSMLPTLQIGDHILVVKFIYGLRLPFTNQVVIPIKEPKRGDVIVFVFPQDQRKDFIKRVIGAPGDIVEIREKKLYINGKPADDPHAVYEDPELFPLALGQRDNFGPITVPAGKYFVMGDNRDQSHDSRFWGFVDRRAVRGKAFMIYFSRGEQGFLGIRWDRLFDLVH